MVNIYENQTDLKVNFEMKESKPKIKSKWKKKKNQNK